LWVPEDVGMKSGEKNGIRNNLSGIKLLCNLPTLLEIL
jgi:hypothetical protein